MAVKKRKKKAASSRLTGKAFVTPFIKDCVKFILADPAIKFMGQGQNRKVTVEKFGTIASTLLGATELGVASRAVPTGPVAVALTAFVNAYPWPPAGGSVGPAGFTSLRPKTVRHVEVAEILEKLLERVNKGHGGGGGNDWPPHIRT